MLEEHILSLEEDINQRDKEIHDLEMKLQVRFINEFSVFNFVTIFSILFNFFDFL